MTCRSVATGVALGAAALLLLSTVDLPDFGPSKPDRGNGRPAAGGDRAGPGGGRPSTLAGAPAAPTAPRANRPAADPVTEYLK